MRGLLDINVLLALSDVRSLESGWRSRLHQGSVTLKDVELDREAPPPSVNATSSR